MTDPGRHLINYIKHTPIIIYMCISLILSFFHSAFACSNAANRDHKDRHFKPSCYSFISNCNSLVLFMTQTTITPIFLQACTFCPPNLLQLQQKQRYIIRDTTDSKQIDRSHFVVWSKFTVYEHWIYTTTPSRISI